MPQQVAAWEAHLEQGCDLARESPVTSSVPCREKDNGTRNVNKNVASEPLASRVGMVTH